jgi:cytoskeletal protein CcmA (bactofilin family)
MDFAGSLDGDLELEGLLWLREIGTIEGDLSVGSVVIEGTVRGNIRALDKAELRATGRVEGDITAGTVAIADGAFFEGRITMAGATQSRTDVSFQEKRSSKK